MLLTVFQRVPRFVDLLKLEQNLCQHSLLAFLITHCARPLALLYSTNASSVRDLRKRFLFWFLSFIALLQSSFQYGTICFLVQFLGFGELVTAASTMHLDMRVVFCSRSSVGRSGPREARHVSWYSFQSTFFKLIRCTLISSCRIEPSMVMWMRKWSLPRFSGRTFHDDLHARLEETREISIGVLLPLRVR